MITKEKIKAARQTDLVTWLQANGYPLKNEGRNHRLEGYGGLVIKDNMWKQFSTKNGGNAIDFLTEILGLSFQDAVERLVGAEGPLPEVPAYRQPEPRHKFTIPAAHPNARRVIAYLTKTRKLPAELVISLIKQKLIWQDIRGNCVFPCLDDECNVVGAILRGTLSDIRWVGKSPGGDVSAGWVMPGQSGTLVVTESPIEAMSLYTLEPGLRGHTFLALGGLRWGAIRVKVEKGVVDKVIIALNPDRWGIEASDAIRAWLQEKEIDTVLLQPDREDWNAELVSRGHEAR